MKLRVPLYARILGWFFLNLVALALVFALWLGTQFHFGLDSLLAGEAGERVRAVSQVIFSELEGRPPTEWNGILERFSRGYQVKFLLFQLNGVQLAGEPVELPREVHVLVTAPGGPGPMRRGPGGGPDSPAPPQGPPGGRLPDRRGPPEFLRLGRPPRVMLRTEKPTRYWVIVRLGLPNPAREQPFPVALLARSETLSGSGLFFDVKPWIAVGAGVVVFSALFWLPFVSRITRSISQMRRATEQLAQGHFDVRVHTRRRDELGALGDAINSMAARLAGFVTGQKRFLGDTAHELCSPIARIQMMLGILEQRADEKQQTQLADLRDEIQEMSHLVNELLSFSRASLGVSSVTLQTVSLSEIVARAVEREAAGGAPIQVNVPEDIRVTAEPELLLRAIANILRNALRYAGAAGPIIISARQVGSDVMLSVADSGPGVPVDALTKIFDPFFRLDPSRTRDTGGAGLGLAIVKTCIEASGGSVSCRNRQPTGLEMEIKLGAAT